MFLPVTLFFLALAHQSADPTLPPPAAIAHYTVVGRGVQIYRCTAQANVFQWTFEEPEAILYDQTGAETGKHSAGPTWTWKDGSALVGKVLQKSPASDSANNIPWLLLEAHSTGGPGALSNITLIRRSNSQGGQPPATGCDAQHQNSLVRVPYQATYTFYTESK
jgi:hypothetical protein